MFPIYPFEIEFFPPLGTPHVRVRTKQSRVTGAGRATSHSAAAGKFSSKFLPFAELSNVRHGPLQLDWWTPTSHDTDDRDQDHDDDRRDNGDHDHFGKFSSGRALSWTCRTELESCLYVLHQIPSPTKNLLGSVFKVFPLDTLHIILTPFILIM